MCHYRTQLVLHHQDFRPVCKEKKFPRVRDPTVRNEPTISLIKSWDVDYISHVAVLKFNTGNFNGSDETTERKSCFFDHYSI